MTHTNHLTSEGAVKGSNVENEHAKTPEGHTVLILFIFFLVILSLFAIGLGLSYLCYRHSSKKRKAQEEREQRARMERRQQIQYQALAAAQFFRGIPNCYSPNPKDENTFLLGLDMSVVPMQLQTQPR